MRCKLKGTDVSVPFNLPGLFSIPEIENNPDMSDFRAITAFDRQKVGTYLLNVFSGTCSLCARLRIFQFLATFSACFSSHIANTDFFDVGASQICRL